MRKLSAPRNGNDFVSWVQFTEPYLFHSSNMQHPTPLSKKKKKTTFGQLLVEGAINADRRSERKGQKETH